MKIHHIALSTLLTVTPCFFPSCFATAMAKEDVADPIFNRALAGRDMRFTPEVLECSPFTKVTTCGKTFDSGLVVLTNNLVCDENIDSVDAAITVVGENTVLDCQNYAITQVNEISSAFYCSGFPGCGLLYKTGVVVKEGAKVINCNINKFYYGGSIDDGGEVESTDFSLNRKALQVVNSVPNTLSKVTKRYVTSSDSMCLCVCPYKNSFFVLHFALTFVSLRVVFYSNFFVNYDGLHVYQQNMDGSAEVLIEEVVVRNNGEKGIVLSGIGIILRNVESSNNDADGLANKGDPESPSGITDFTFEGKVYLINNGNNGLWIRSSNNITPNGIVRITGELITDRNAFSGVNMTSNTNVTIVLGKGPFSGKARKGSSGSLTACDNGNYDIANEGDGSFEGTDYTCNSTLGNQDLLPVCKSCPKCSHSLFA